MHFLGGFAPRTPISPGRVFFKGANLPKPVHAPHPHPAQVPSSDAQPYKKPANLPPTPLFPQVTLPQNPNLPIFCTLPTKNKHQRGRVRPPSNGLQLIDLNHSTRPTHQPQQAPPSQTLLSTKTRQICAPAPSFPSSRHPKTQICRFSVLSPPKTNTNGAECALPPSTA